MTIYAQITGGTITRTTEGFTEPGYGEDGNWHDFSDPDVRGAYLDENGWHVVIEIDRPADTVTHTYNLTYELVDGQPTQVWTAREWTLKEINDRAERDARLDDHNARIARLEAKVFPSAIDPATPDDPTVPTWDELGGVWPNSGLLRDSGKVYRNVSGVPLTTPPSGFPGGPNRWKHMFVEVTTGAAPDPTRPEGYVGPWSAQTTYKVGDVCDRARRYYRCRVAHGPEYQGTWGPPQASVWDDIGAAPTTAQASSKGRPQK